MEVPETRYAKSGNVHVAYQVTGGGHVDFVFVPGFASHIEYQWEEPLQARFFSRLGSMGRLIRFDKRGTGLSDPVQAVPTLEERMDDVRAVMEAAGSERAVLLGLSEGGPLSVLFAATHPERVEALVLWNTFARIEHAPDYPMGAVPEVLDQFTTGLETEWGSGVFVNLWVASLASDPVFQDWWTRFERLALSPGTALALYQLYRAVDVRAVLPNVRMPTLVLHAVADTLCPIAHGRYLAEHIPGARFVELPGRDHFSWREGDLIADEIEEFLTGERTGAALDRVLATILFSDIVGSTERAVELGDRRWRDLLDAHDTMARRQLQRFRGREIKSMGDGFLATFDGPARAIQCGRALRDGARGLGVEVRVGLHTGEVEVRDADIGGIAVHIAQRIEAHAAANEVLVSRTVVDLVAGSGLTFVDQGSHSLKGVPDEWRLFALE